MTGIWCKDPDSFIPERWEVDSVDAEQLKRCVIPFGLGKRQCIGMTLASMELRIILATLLRHFEFQFVSDPEHIETELVLVAKPKNVTMKVKSRHHRLP